jgi:arylsulfatase A-like enzyme
VNSEIPERSVGLDPSTLTIPDVLGPLGYESWILGKWHLGGGIPPDPDHPRASGFDSHAGSYANFVHITPEESYYDWTKSIDGVTYPNHTVYATTDTVDETLARIAQAQGPWFAWVAFNAAHGPWEAPPSQLHGFDLTGAGIAEKVKAMIEAVDTEVGRLLSQMDPAVLAQTTVFVLGDNGTLGLATTAPFPADHAKFTLYEGGVRVPLIVAGQSVPLANRNQELECDALVHAQDLFSTIVTLAGGTSTVTSSLSFLDYLTNPGDPSTRSYLYSETYLPNGVGAIRTSWSGAVRDDRYKLLIPDLLGSDEFYDLDLDPYEANDLLAGTLSSAEQSAYDALAPALDAEKFESVPEPGGGARAWLIACGLLLLHHSARAVSDFRPSAADTRWAMSRPAPE